MINYPLAIFCIGGVFIGMGMARMMGRPSHYRKPRSHGEKKAYYSYLDILMHRRHWFYIKENPRPFVTFGLIAGAFIVALVFIFAISISMRI